MNKVKHRSTLVKKKKCKYVFLQSWIKFPSPHYFLRVLAYHFLFLLSLFHFLSFCCPEWQHPSSVMSFDSGVKTSDQSMNYHMKRGVRHSTLYDATDLCADDIVRNHKIFLKQKLPRRDRFYFFGNKNRPKVIKMPNFFFLYVRNWCFFEWLIFSEKFSWKDGMLKAKE